MTLGDAGTARPATTSRRDEARALVGRRGLAASATETVVRAAMARVPPSMVDRARVLLRRFFSDASWRVDDDVALAAIVGPGTGTTRHTLDDDLVLVVAFRASSLRVDLEYRAPVTPVESIDPRSAGDATSDSRAPTDEIAATFDLPVVPECGPNPRVVRFLTGPGTGGSGGWMRDLNSTRDDRVARVLRTFVDVTGVLLGTGFVAVELGDERRWDELLAPMMTTIGDAFGVDRVPVAVDRVLEQARLDFAGVDPTSAKGIARARDALRSLNAGVRQVAVELLEYDDPFSSERAWRAALGDSSRAVRRAAVLTMARVQREELRPLLERGLAEHDACARYHAVIGIGRIGVERSRTALERCLADSDARVRLAARRLV